MVSEFHKPRFDERGSATGKAAVFTSFVVVGTCVLAALYSNPNTLTGTPSDTESDGTSNYGSADSDPTPDPSDSPSPTAKPSSKPKPVQTVVDVPHWPSASHPVHYKDKNKSALLLNELLHQNGCLQTDEGEMNDLNMRGLWEFQTRAGFDLSDFKKQYGKKAYLHTSAGAKTGKALKWLALDGGDTTCGASYAPSNRTPGCPNKAGGKTVLGPAVPGTVCKGGAVPVPDMKIDPGCPGSRIPNFVIKTYCEANDGHKEGYYKDGKYLGKKG